MPELSAYQDSTEGRHGKVIVVLLSWLSPVIEFIVIELSYDAR